jgi:hypothetical protein
VTTPPFETFRIGGTLLSFAASKGLSTGRASPSRTAAATALPSSGLHLDGEPRKWPVQAWGLLRSRKTDSLSRISMTGTPVSGSSLAVSLTGTRAGNSPADQIGAASLNAGPVTSSRPIHRETPVR